MLGDEVAFNNRPWSYVKDRVVTSRVKDSDSSQLESRFRTTRLDSTRVHGHKTTRLDSSHRIQRLYLDSTR